MSSDNESCAWKAGAEVRMSRGRGMRRGAILEKCWAVYLRVIEAEVRRWGNWPPSLHSTTAAAAKWVTGRQTAFMSHNRTHAHAFSCHVFPMMDALGIKCTATAQEKICPSPFFGLLMKRLLELTMCRVWALISLLNNKLFITLQVATVPGRGHYTQQQLNV